MQDYGEAMEQCSEIYQAIEENNAPLLDTLLAPVNRYNNKEKSCSHHSAKATFLPEGILSRAVELQHTDCVNVILDKVRSKELPQTIIDRFVWWSNHQAPLSIACQKGNLNIVQMLIECGCTLSFRNDAFSIAFEQGHQLLSP